MKKSLHLFILIFAAALIAAPSVFGNGQKEQTGTSSGPVTVTLWGIHTGANRQMTIDATKAFNESQNKIKVVTEWFQNNPYKNKIRIALGAGNGPDIFYNWGGGPLRSYVQAGDVVDLTPYLSADPAWKNRFAKSVWGAATVDGKVYAVPTQSSVAEMLFYNKGLLAEYHLPAPVTWDKLLTDVKMLHKNGIAAVGLAGKSEWPEMIWVQYLTDRVGGPQVFNAIAAGKKDAWSNPAIIKALQMCQQLAKAGAFEPGYASVSASTNQVEALIAANKAAMVAQGSWVYSTFINNFDSFVKAGNLGYTAIPSVDPRYAKEVVGAASDYFSVAKTSKHPDAAVEYLKKVDLNNFEVKTMITKLGLIPPVKGVAPLLKNTAHGAFDSWLYTQISQAPDVQLYWDQYLSPTEAKIMLTNISQVFLLQETPAQFAKNMNQAMSSQS